MREIAKARRQQAKAGGDQRRNFEPTASTTMERTAHGSMASDSLQNICALEPGLKRSENVQPRHHASWLEPSERCDAACIDAIRADALTDAISLDARSLAAMSLAAMSLGEMSFGGDVVGGPCDIEDR